jgi:hypothetical protein
VVIVDWNLEAPALSERKSHSSCATGARCMVVAHPCRCALPSTHARQQVEFIVQLLAIGRGPNTCRILARVHYTFLHRRALIWRAKHDVISNKPLHPPTSENERTREHSPHQPTTDPSATHSPRPSQAKPIGFESDKLGQGTAQGTCMLHNCARFLNTKVHLSFSYPVGYMHCTCHVCSPTTDSSRYHCGVIASNG